MAVAVCQVKYDKPTKTRAVKEQSILSQPLLYIEAAVL